MVAEALLDVWMVAQMRSWMSGCLDGSKPKLEETRNYNMPKLLIMTCDKLRARKGLLSLTGEHVHIYDH